MKKKTSFFLVTILLLIFSSTINHNPVSKRPVQQVAHANSATNYYLPFIINNWSTGVLVGAGDIAGCSYDEDEETAKLLDNTPGTVFTLGDNVYPDGTEEEFSNCYSPTWGRHRDRTRPSPGNHDYHVSGAAGYFKYFGAAAGEVDKGYYSYDIGAWHIQFNVVDTALLKDAQVHPENYRDLVVRVAGFSAYWVELSKGVQEEIIARTEFGSC